jgi:hypothetical protein
MTCAPAGPGGDATVCVPDGTHRHAVACGDEVLPSIVTERSRHRGASRRPSIRISSDA